MLKIIVSPSTDNEIKRPDLKYVRDVGDISLDESIEYCLVTLDKVKDIQRAIKRFRTSKKLCLTPLFIRQCPIQLTEGIIDAYDPSMDQLETVAQHINTKLADIEQGIDFDDEEQLLLSFLYSRDGLCLEPVIDATSPQLARYPLVEYFIEDKRVALKAVLSLASQDLLQASEIVDEIQCCPHCHNGWLSYRNTCPECQSVDIQKTAYLHCYRCGNTEPEYHFLKKNILICQRCNSQLSHIGIDYDRPLEEYLCVKNKHQFIDTKVICRCLSCKQDIATEHLYSQKISRYRLGDRGANHLHSKQALLSSDLKDEDNFCDPTYFSMFVDWMLRACSRHDKMSFSLVTIRILNTKELTQQLGLSKSRQLFRDFFAHLRAQLRTTDMGQRSDSGQVLLLLPQASSSSISAIRTNLGKFIKQYKTQELITIRLSFHSISSDEIQIDKYDAQLLLYELNTRSHRD